MFINVRSDANLDVLNFIVKKENCTKENCLTLSSPVMARWSYHHQRTQFLLKM